MERRLARLKLSLARILLGFIFGFASGLTPSTISAALFTAYIAVAVAVLGYYAKPRMKVLHGSEPYYVGVVSGLAAFAIGLIMSATV